MNFTKEEFDTLSKYEGNLHTAYYSDYSRNVMRKDLEIIYEIYCRVSGTRQSMNYGCGSCQLSLLKRVGKRYFEDKQAYERTEPDLTINELEGAATNNEEKTKKKNGKNNTRKKAKN